VCPNVLTSPPRFFDNLLLGFFRLFNEDQINNERDPVPNPEPDRFAQNFFAKIVKQACFVTVSSMRSGGYVFHWDGETEVNQR